VGGGQKEEQGEEKSRCGLCRFVFRDKKLEKKKRRIN